MKDGNSDAYDVVIIGSGSAGLAAARGATARGLRVAVVERDTYLGGECPNYACVPTKALLHAAWVYTTAEHADEVGVNIGDLTLNYAQLKRYKDHIVAQTGGHNLTAERLAADGITLVRGNATFVDSHTIDVAGHRLPARQIVLATGSTTRLPAIVGLDRVPYLTSKTAIDLTTQPHSLIILGAGPVGVEFAQLFSALGTDVTLIQQSNRILPHEEPEISQAIAASLASYGVEIKTDFTTEAIESSDTGIIINGKTKTTVGSFEAEQLLVATGQQAQITGLNLENVGVEITERGITVDQYLRTSVPHIWAAGDVVGSFQYTHAAHAMGVVVAHNLALSDRRTFDDRVLPRVVYTHLEAASVGQTEAQLTEAGTRVVTGLAPIGQLGRALTDQEPEGLVKIVADAASGEVLGTSIACVRAGEMIHELALAMTVHASVRDIASTIHAYPTYSEAIAIAAAEAASKL